jgi:hypothetical protein
MRKLTSLGIDIDDVAHQLEVDGIEKFAKPFGKLLRGIEQKVRGGLICPYRSFICWPGPR